MPRDGCKECSRRRINCDKGTPECAKCLKKGIKCTGVGRQIRFVNGVISKGKRKGRAFPDVDFTATRLIQHLDDATVAKPCLAVETEAFQTSTTLNSCAIISEENDIDDENDGTALVRYQGQHGLSSYRSTNDSTVIPVTFDPAADLTLELMKPGIQMLFNHFSQSIAWIMVVFDNKYNGYRNFLLPLAYQDDLVQRAVSVVAAFHLSAQRPDLLPAAESGRAAIIEKLRSDAFIGGSDKVFNISTWATIILLLVGETVTGSRDFVHLFPMLTNLLSHQRLLATDSSPEREFLLQQSRMFQLFTPPLLDPSQGYETFQTDLSFYFGFLFPEDYSDNPQATRNAIIFQEAIKQARNIYVKQAQGKYTPERLFMDIEGLRILVLPIESDSPCMHTLPWVYFIAAALSKDQDHRDFFAGRLAQVYEKTRMNNIIVALERLEKIWLLQPNGEWVNNPSLVGPVLIL